MAFLPLRSNQTAIEWPFGTAMCKCQRFVPLVDRFDKFSGSDVESVGQLHDVNQADVSLPALDTADIIAV